MSAMNDWTISDAWDVARMETSAGSLIAPAVTET